MTKPIGNETKFINELKRAIQAHEKKHSSSNSVIWKIRGTASSSGRPDLLVITDSSYFIEAKVVPIKDIYKSKRDLFKLPTRQQLAHLVMIAQAGAEAYLAIKTSHDEGILIDMRGVIDHHDDYFTKPYIFSEHCGGNDCGCCKSIKKEKGVWKLWE